MTAFKDLASKAYVAVPADQTSRLRSICSMVHETESGRLASKPELYSMAVRDAPVDEIEGFLCSRSAKFHNCSRIMAKIIQKKNIKGDIQLQLPKPPWKLHCSDQKHIKPANNRGDKTLQHNCITIPFFTHPSVAGTCLDSHSTLRDLWHSILLCLSPLTMQIVHLPSGLALPANNSNMVVVQSGKTLPKQL